MNKLLAGCLASIFCFSIANADVITFDDIQGANKNIDRNIITNGYEGLNWDNMNVIHKDYYSYDNGYTNGVVSGEWVAYNAYGDLSTVSDEKFDFNGAYFTSAWEDDNVVTAKGYNDGDLLFNKSFAVTTGGSIWVDCDFLNIDELKFTSSHFQFAMDNFTINKINNVPEPTLISLIGFGLLSLLGFSRKKRS